MDSISGQGMKILRAAWLGQKKKKKKPPQNKSNFKKAFEHFSNMN